MSRNRYDPAARRVARLAAVQALYQMENGEAGIDAVIAEFAAHRFGNDPDGETLPGADADHFERILRGVVAEQATVDRGVNAILREGWPLERLDTTVRAILRAAAFELLACTDIPPKVIINEYLDVAHAFYEGEEPRFINGVLDHLSRVWRKAPAPGAPA